MASTNAIEEARVRIIFNVFQRFSNLARNTAICSDVAEERSRRSSLLFNGILPTKVMLMMKMRSSEEALSNNQKGTGRDWSYCLNVQTGSNIAVPRKQIKNSGFI